VVPRAFVRRPADHDDRRPWRSTRRGLLLAGGATIVAGCGKEEVAALPAVTEVLLRSVAAERALAVAARLQRSSDRALLRRIAERADDRAGRAAAALSAAGGRPHDAPAPGDRVGDPLERGRAALEAHVAAMPSLSGRELRSLGAFLVEGSAADLAVLNDLLGTAPGGAFPGMPA
jgi:hypothetical protein